MSFSKKMLTFAAVSALTAATAVPAMALENEFHGMYKFMGYQTNFLSGNNQFFLAQDAPSGFFAEQRARIMYTAKASDNLKLVTHFELDTRFGGLAEANYKGIAGNDAGNIDADAVSLETKNVYLDFKCPITGTNMKVGIQPWGDSYGSLFLAADMTGVYATKKFDPLTASLGWFRFDDNTVAATDQVSGPGQFTGDLIIADVKFAVNKDMTVGASYYNVQNDTVAIPATVGTTTPTVTPATAAVPRATGYDLLHVLGVNADLKFGPAAVKPFAAYQFGEVNGSDDISAYLLGATAKVKVGPGAVNLAGFYMSGDDNGTGDSDSFQTLGGAFTYFNAANMWLLIRPNQAIGTSNSVLGNDMTVGGRGSIGLFAGYEGTMDKVFYNANIGYMMTAEERGSEDDVIGTEINAQVGYKMYDNLSVSAAAAYAFLGDGLSSSTAAERFGGAADADDPYLFNVQVSYVF